MFDSGFMYSINKNNVLTSGTVGKIVCIMSGLAGSTFPYDKAEVCSSVNILGNKLRYLH